MTIQEFVTNNLNSTIGDGQCVALILKYENDVLNLTPTGVGNAHDYYDLFDTTPFLYNNFNKFTYNGSNKPEIGDIIVWNTNVGGGYGHVDIAYQNISNTSFIGFDQNWNSPLRTSIENHNYNNVLGWLRKKSPSPPIPTTFKKSKFPFVLYARKLRKGY